MCDEFLAPLSRFEILRLRRDKGTLMFGADSMP
jgi:hypothetical protein